MTNQPIYNQWKIMLLLVFLLSTFHSVAKGLTISTPSITIPDTVEVCRLDSGIDSVCINFETLAVGSTGTWTQDGFIPGFNFSDFPLDNVCFEGIQVGCYPFTFTTNTAVPPCVDTMATMMVCVNPCPCPSPATNPIDQICNVGTLDIELMLLTTDPGTWSIESGPSGQDLTSILTGTIFDANGILAGDYIVRFTLDSPGIPPCESFSEQTITVFDAPIVNAVNGVMCNIEGLSDPAVLDLYSLISVDATDGGSWTQVGTPIVNITGANMSTIMSSDLATFPEVLMFEYTSGVEAGSPCPPAVITVEVLVKDCNCPFLNVLSDSLCNDNMAIDLNSLLENPDGLSGTWSTNGTLIGASIFDPFGLPSGIYDITFTLDDPPGPNCEEAFSNVVLVSAGGIAIPIFGPNPCNVDSGIGSTIVNLYDWLDSGYTSGSWEQTGGDILPLPDDGIDIVMVDFVNQEIGESFTFVFTTSSAQFPCADVSVEIVVTVIDCACPPIALSSPTAINNDTGYVDMCLLLGNSDPGTFTVLNSAGEDQSAYIDSSGCIFNAMGIAPGTYSIIYTLDLVVPDICIQSITEFVEVIGVVSTKAIKKDNIQIYPNPTSEILSVKSDYKISLLKLYSMTGNCIHSIQSTSENNIKIDLSSYPLGIYLLQIETDMGRLTEKVIKK